jgi:hypothetical protein
VTAAHSEALTHITATQLHRLIDLLMRVAIGPDPDATKVIDADREPIGR